MRTLYYDCFAGISGDMNLGAMIDLGVEVEYLKSELAKLNIEGFQLKIEKAQRRGISGTLATVIVENQDNGKHRHLHHVEEIVNSSTLTEEVKKTALDIFTRIAVAEAKVHDIDIQKVHFHEVGALDSIADIVGAAICLHSLKIDKIMAAPIQLGGGTVKCAHGVMPVPAPATALIVENIPVKIGLVKHEATTPTGAAILAATVDEFTEVFSKSITKIAYGIGQRDVSEVPNILRLYLSETEDSNKACEVEDAMVLACNIDDMKAEHYEFLLDKLFDAGASDAWLTPIIMKKSRPAVTVSVLCELTKVELLKTLLFEHSTTLGVREQSVSKNRLKRAYKTIRTKYGEVAIKECYYKDKLLRSKPEYETCKALAKKHNVPMAEIENEVLRNS